MFLSTFLPSHLWSKIALGPEDAGGKPDGLVWALLNHRSTCSEHSCPQSMCSGGYMHMDLTDVVGFHSRCILWLITQEQQEQIKTMFLHPPRTFVFLFPSLSSFSFFQFIFILCVYAVFVLCVYVSVCAICVYYMSVCHMCMCYVCVYVCSVYVCSLCVYSVCMNACVLCIYAMCVCCMCVSLCYVSVCYVCKCYVYTCAMCVLCVCQVRGR